MEVGALCAGAAVGAAFNELQTVLLNVIKTIAQFKSTLKRLEATVNSVSSIVGDIKKFESLKSLERPQHELVMFTDQLKKGTDLIRLCSKIKFWNLYKKYDYSKKLQSFDRQLVRFFQIDVQAHQVRSLSRIYMGVSDVRDKLDSVRNDILHDVNEKLGSMRLSSLSSSGSSTFSGFSCVGDLPELILGLDLPLLEVKSMLLNDDTNSSSVVLLSAPPGCGKTTLAKMVCSDPEIIGKFKNILFVTVSKTVNIKVIVQKIFQQKGRLPELLEVLSDEDAINQLGLLLRRIGGELQEGPTLLTLDDVWSPELISLIDKFSFRGIPGYKLLVTSRSHPPGLQTVYRLKLLNHQDATQLFSRKAFPPDSPHPQVSTDIIKEVVKACNGFPLALNVVALSLRGQCEAIWRNTLDKWSKGRSSIFDSSSELLNNLKTSLDALDEERDTKHLKDYFLDLGSFPEDQRIPVTALLDMWVELYDELDEDGMYTYSGINELSTRNLLNLVTMRKDDSCDLDGFCNGQYVTLHDMLRELAIHQCSQQDIVLRKKLIIEMVGNSLPRELDKSLKQPLHGHLVSISTEDSFTSSWWDMQLPDAKVLILNLRSGNYTLPQFIKAMDRLKVLIVTNYGFSLAKLDNFPVIGIISNLKRIRLEHVSISSSFDTAVAFKLMNLQKISLTMCEIGNALDNGADMFPNLVEIEMEYCRDLVKLPAGLCDCVLLKKVSITSCNELCTLPNEIGKWKNLQSLRLNSCTRLEEIPETIGCLQELNLLDISDCLSLSELPNQLGDLRGLETLHMRGCWGLFELPSSVEELNSLTVLCDKQTSTLWEFYGNVKVVIVKEDINLNWLHN